MRPLTILRSYSINKAKTVGGTNSSLIQALTQILNSHKTAETHKKESNASQGMLFSNMTPAPKFDFERPKELHNSDLLSLSNAHPKPAIALKKYVDPLKKFKVNLSNLHLVLPFILHHLTYFLEYLASGLKSFEPRKDTKQVSNRNVE